MNAWSKLSLPPEHADSPSRGLEIIAASPPVFNSTDSIRRVILTSNRYSFVVSTQTIWDGNLLYELGSGRYFDGFSGYDDTDVVRGTKYLAAVKAFVEETNRWLGI